MPRDSIVYFTRGGKHVGMCLSRFIAGWNGSESNFGMSYEALSTYIRAETSVFLQVCCAEERDVVNWEYVGELIVNIGGLRRHLLPTAGLPIIEKKTPLKGVKYLRKLAKTPFATFAFSSNLKKNTVFDYPIAPSFN